MLDSMWAYGYEDALRVGIAVEDLNYYWYEDPLVDDDLYNYVKLRQKLRIPILATEYARERTSGWRNGYSRAALICSGATSRSRAALPL